LPTARLTDRKNFLTDDRLDSLKLPFVAKISMYAAELNPVLARKLYPRALPMIDDLTDADKQVLGDLVHAERRREDQAIGVGFGDRAAEQAADDAAKHADSRAADG